MLKLFESTIGINVMSLRTGGPVATVTAAIINPNNLFIEAWSVQDSRSKENLILLSNDVRDVLPQGFAINDHEVLSSPDELVRLKSITELNFDLIGLKVESESKKSYGKVNDYAYESSSMYIQKIYASQTALKSLTGGSLSIDRTQIIEITNKRLVIADPTEKAKAPITSPSIAT